MLFQPLSPEDLVVRLAAIVDSSEDAIIGTDEHGTINTWNAAAARLLGYTADEILGESILVLVPPELHHEQRAHMENLRTGGRVQHYDTVCIAKGGKRVELSLAVSAIKDGDGRLIGTAVIARDVTTRQREFAARARLAAIIESSDDAIVAKDLNGVITDWNAAAERIFGYTKEEIVGRSVLTLIPPDLQHEEPVILQKVRSGQPVHFETERVHKSGRRIAISLTTSPIRDASGKVIGASKIVRDISDRRRNENARLMLAAIVESSDDAIISKNLDGIITTWNKGAERIFGYHADEILGHSVLKLIPRDLHWEEPQIITKIRSGERIEHYETKRLKKNGEVFDISLTVSPINDDQGQVIGVSKIVRDISDRKAAESLLLEREKLAAVGRIAATLAHEVNNPLESIMNLSYLISEHRGLPDDLREMAQLLVQEVSRAGDITRQALTYYRETKISGAVDVAATIEHVLKAKQKKLAGKNIKVETDFRPRAVHGFPGELRQVFDNIIENAIEASRNGGMLRIRTRNSSASGAERVVITICDNGSGIPSNVLRNIFQPFFTTKLRNGSGLGLWVSQGIVQKHGGTIRVRTRERGQSGSVFRVSLPASTPARADKAPMREAAGD